MTAILMQRVREEQPKAEQQSMQHLHQQAQAVRRVPVQAPGELPTEQELALVQAQQQEPPKAVSLLVQAESRSAELGQVPELVQAVEQGEPAPQQESKHR